MFVGGIVAMMVTPSASVWIMIDVKRAAEKEADEFHPRPSEGELRVAKGTISAARESNLQQVNGEELAKAYQVLGQESAHHQTANELKGENGKTGIAVVGGAIAMVGGLIATVVGGHTFLNQRQESLMGRLKSAGTAVEHS